MMTMMKGITLFGNGPLKRALVLVVVVAVCVAGFLSIRGAMPFMAVYGISMEPELHAGNLILISEVMPDEIEVGDIIVFTVPEAVREHYNYPPVVAHRVIQVRSSEQGVTFRTKGDNTGEDPFTVRPEDLRGEVSRQVPYLGFPLLFFQSDQGLIFIISALSLLALYLYTDEIGRARQSLHRGLFAPVIKASVHSGEELAKRLENTEKGMESTQQALTSFAAAIAEYAEHLKSHTSAIQGLAEASQELKKGAAEQNRVLAHLVETIGKGKPVAEEAAPAEEAERLKKAKFPPGCARARLKSPDDQPPIFGAG
jgi:signal peptidase